MHLLRVKKRKLAEVSPTVGATESGNADVKKDLEGKGDKKEEPAVPAYTVSTLLANIL